MPPGTSHMCVPPIPGIRVSLFLGVPSLQSSQKVQSKDFIFAVFMLPNKGMFNQIAFQKNKNKSSNINQEDE